MFTALLVVALLVLLSKLILSTKVWIALAFTVAAIFIVIQEVYDRLRSKK